MSRFVDFIIIFDGSSDVMHFIFLLLIEINSFNFDLTVGP